MPREHRRKPNFAVATAVNMCAEHGIRSTDSAKKALGAFLEQYLKEVSACIADPVRKSGKKTVTLEAVRLWLGTQPGALPGDY